VVGVAQLVTTNVGDYFRYRAQEAQMRLTHDRLEAQMRLTGAQMEAQMRLTRDRLIFGSVEKCAYLIVTLVLAALFCTALMAQVRKLVNLLVSAIRSRRQGTKTDPHGRSCNHSHSTTR